jgi:hypothetical protein
MDKGGTPTSSVTYPWYVVRNRNRGRAKLSKSRAQGTGLKAQGKERIEQLWFTASFVFCIPSMSMGHRA